MQVIYTLEQANEILNLLSVGNIDKLSVNKDSNGVYVINYEIDENLKQLSPKVFATFQEFVSHMEIGDVDFFSLKFIHNKEYSCSKAYASSAKADDEQETVDYTSDELKQLLIDQLTKEGKIDESVEVYNRVQGSGKQKRYIPMTVREILEKI